MPVFEYRGHNSKGQNVKGTLDAENARIARIELKKQKIFVNTLKDKTKTKNASKKSGSLSKVSVNVEDLSLLTRQLAVLLKANVPLVESLSAVADQVENEQLSVVVSDVKNQVNEGGSFNAALRGYPKVFNNIFCSMCEAGEMAGNLDVILMRLAEFTENQKELNSKIKSAMIYPIIMMLACLGILAFIFIKVVPSMTEIFESRDDIVLPWYSTVVINISGFLVNYWMYILGSLFVAYLLFKGWKDSESGKPTWDRIKLRMPVFGKLSRTVATARFTRTFSTLLTGGVDVVGSLDIVKHVVDNKVLADAIEEAKDNIKEGESIAGPLKKSGQFPPIVTHMIGIGEKTGDLETMLTYVSDAYDFQVKNTVDGLTAALGPIMLVFMGGIVAVIVFSIMIPMMQMNNFN